MKKITHALLALSIFFAPALAWSECDSGGYEGCYCSCTAAYDYCIEDIDTSQGPPDLKACWNEYMSCWNGCDPWVL